jgi:hypothetical protein
MQLPFVSSFLEVGGVVGSSFCSIRLRRVFFLFCIAAISGAMGRKEIRVS